jgi:hypothetical protein
MAICRPSFDLDLVAAEKDSLAAFVLGLAEGYARPRYSG